MPTNAAWPNEVKPPTPVNSTRPSATSAPIPTSFNKPTAKLPRTSGASASKATMAAATTEPNLVMAIPAPCSLVDFLFFFLDPRREQRTQQQHRNQGAEDEDVL